MKDSSLLKALVLLLFVMLSITGMYYAADFLIPIFFAALISMLLLPVCRNLEKWGFARVPSIIFSILLVIIVIVGVFFLFYKQVLSFTNDIEQVQAKLLEKYKIVEKTIEEKTGVSSEEQMKWLNEKYSSFMKNGASPIIKGFVTGFTGGIISFSLMNIYIFFFLLYRDRFKKFILSLFHKEHHTKVEDVINRIKGLVLHYLSGLLIALTILGTMNAIGLLALGIRQAIFLGYLAGFLNIIPYVGTMIGSMLPVLVALLFEDSIWTAVGVAAIFSFNQFIDNNITTPKVVGSHVQVNPLATIMAVILGGMIWGIPGMVLFIPVIGVFKIICDNVDQLKPLGYLLGEDTQENKPSLPKKIINLLKKNKK